MKRAAAMLVVAAALSPGARPVCASGPDAGQAIGASAIAEAVAIGFDRGGGARHAAFHEPYVLRHGGAVLRSLEVVTEFRRVVLLAEERLRRGDASWDARAAAEALAPYRGRLDLVLHLRFSPQNTFRSMPPVDVTIYPRAAAKAPGLQPLHVEATPSNLAGPVPPAGTPILAATVEAAFPASSLDFQATYLVAVSIDGREVERVPLDLSRLR